MRRFPSRIRRVRNRVIGCSIGLVCVAIVNEGLPYIVRSIVIGTALTQSLFEDISATRAV